MGRRPRERQLMACKCGEVTGLRGDLCDRCFADAWHRVTPANPDARLKYVIGAPKTRFDHINEDTE